MPFQHLLKSQQEIEKEARDRRYQIATIVLVSLGLLVGVASLVVAILK